MNYTLNYVSCVQIFGRSYGISMIKYYDSQYLISIVFGVIINFLFPMNHKGFNSIFCILMAINVLGMLLLVRFPKPYSSTELSQKNKQNNDQENV